MLRYFFLFTLLQSLCIHSAFAQSSAGNDDEWYFGGHSKFQLFYLPFPGNSIFRDALGPHATDEYTETRLKLSGRKGRWDAQVAYQFIAVHSDTLPLTEQLPGVALPLNSVISDDRRWFDLTTSWTNDNRTAIVNRLDRLNVGYTTERSVWRFGRQAISWGNGLLFNPIDVFNPFDPSAVDKEYKTGDDMLYGQYLFDSGSDLQGVAIVRRNPRNGNVEADQSSLAFKYHGFMGMNEYDLLAAQHYGDPLLGAGGSMNLGGAVLRGDVTWTRTELQDVVSAVASISYSWTWGGKNISGLVEYYYGGFGQAHSDYAPEDLLRNPDLVERIERGELYTLGRQYIGASATIEMTPLLLLTPNAFINLQDPSMLAQIVAQYDWKQDLVLLAAMNLPVGADGTEYGGIPAPAENLYFSTDPSLFLQLAWYY